MELSDIKKNEKSENKPHKNLPTIDSSNIVPRKRSVLRRLFDDVKPENDESIITYVVTKVVVPSILNTIHDALVSSIDLFFTGSTKHTSGSRKRLWNPDGEFDYTSRSNKAYSGSSGQTPTLSSLRYRRQDFRDYLVFANYETATLLRDILQSHIDEEGQVSVNDLYKILDIDEVTNDWYNDTIGWTSIVGTKIRQLGRDRWELVLPRLEKL